MAGISAEQGRGILFGDRERDQRVTTLQFRLEAQNIQMLRVMSKPPVRPAPPPSKSGELIVEGQAFRGFGLPRGPVLIEIKFTAFAQKQRRPGAGNQNSIAFMFV